MVARLLFVLCVAMMFCSAKDRQWRSGQILDSQAAEAYLGNVHPGSHGRSYDFQPKTSLDTHGRSIIFIPSYGVRETYVIESGSDRFIATRVLHSDKPSKDPSSAREVKFAVEKRSLFMLDEKGREHKFKLLRDQK